MCGCSSRESSRQSRVSKGLVFMGRRVADGWQGWQKKRQILSGGGQHRLRAAERAEVEAKRADGEAEVAKVEAERADGESEVAKGETERADGETEDRYVPVTTECSREAGGLSSHAVFCRCKRGSIPMASLSPSSMNNSCGHASPIPSPRAPRPAARLRNGHPHHIPPPPAIDIPLSRAMKPGLVKHQRALHAHAHHARA